MSCQRSKQSHLLTTALCPSGFSTSVPLGQNSSSSAHLLSDSPSTSEHHFRTLFSTKSYAPGAVPWTPHSLSVSSACSPAPVAAEGISAVPGSSAIGASSGRSRKRLASAPWPSAKTRPPLAGVQHKVNRVSQPDFKQQNNWEIWLTAPGFGIQNTEVPRSKNPLWIPGLPGCQMDPLQLILWRKCSNIAIVVSYT